MNKKSNTLAHLAVALSLPLLAGLAVVINPATSGATTASTTVSSVLSPVISLFTTNGTVNVNLTPTGAGVQTIASDTATVSTNDASGYTLQLAESSAATTMASGGNSIPASSGTQAVPVVMAANTWGYRVDGVGGFGAGPTSSASSTAISGSIKFAAVPASGSPNTLVSTSSTASNATTNIWYGVAANTTQPSGTYTNSVTYTVTAN